MNTDYKSNANSKETTETASKRPVMLALSTFKHSDRVIETDMEKTTQMRLADIWQRRVSGFFKEAKIIRNLIENRFHQ